MKKILSAFCLSCIIFLACNNERNQGKDRLVDTTGSAIKKDRSSRAVIAESGAQKTETDNDMRDKILGIWSFVGDENATFVIAKDKITYPDKNASYKYILRNDSILIKFDGFDGNYLVKTRGADTLILKGDEEQVYYRFKK